MKNLLFMKTVLAFSIALFTACHAPVESPHPAPKPLPDKELLRYCSGGSNGSSRYTEAECVSLACTHAGGVYDPLNWGCDCGAGKMLSFDPTTRHSSCVDSDETSIATSRFRNWNTLALGRELNPRDLSVEQSAAFDLLKQEGAVFLNQVLYSNLSRDTTLSLISSENREQSNCLESCRISRKLRTLALRSIQSPHLQLQVRHEIDLVLGRKVSQQIALYQGDHLVGLVTENSGAKPTYVITRSKTFEGIPKNFPQSTENLLIFVEAGDGI